MSDPAWPFAVDGVVESVIATRQPDDVWNQAALGLRGSPDHDPTDPVTGRTWGNTRTRRNLQRTGGGVVQFVDDPVAYVDAALGIRETADPVTDAAAGWVEVAAERIAAGQDGGTDWIDWELHPVETEVVRRTVPRTNRGAAAVIELTVAASRLDVPAYDEAALRERLSYFDDVVDRCGTVRDRAARDRIAELVPWEPDGSTAAVDDPDHQEV